MNNEKNKTKGIGILLAGIGILIYQIIPSIFSPYSLLEISTIIILIFGILLLIIGRRFYMKPMEPIEGDKKLGNYIHIVGVLIFILTLLSFPLYVFIYIPNDMFWISSGLIISLIELFLFGIVLMFIGKIIIKPMEVLDKKKKLGTRMLDIGVITSILSIFSLVIDAVNLIIFFISVWILIYGIILLQKAETDITMEVKEEIKSPDFIMEAIGTNGRLQLFENKIILKKKVGFLIFRAGREKMIPISSISSIQFSGAKIFKKAYGFIQFSFGGPTKSLRFDNIKRDPDAIVFTFREARKFEKIKVLIEERMIKSQEVVTPLGQTSSNLDEIEKLAKLYDKGIITKEEFEAKKKQLLGL